MRNSPLKGMLNAASPIKQRAVDYVPPPAPKPTKEEKEKKETPPPKKGPTTYIPKKGGGYTALTEPN